MHPGCPIEQVYLCREPIDFRKAINGLSVLVEQELGLNPFASALYVFTNRHHNKVKALYWHRNVRISAMAATDFNLIADSVSLRRRTAFHRDRGHRRGRPSDRADVSAGGYRGG